MLVSDNLFLTTDTTFFNLSSPDNQILCEIFAYTNNLTIPVAPVKFEMNIFYENPQFPVVIIQNSYLLT